MTGATTNAVVIDATGLTVGPGFRIFRNSKMKSTEDCKTLCDLLEFHFCSHTFVETIAYTELQHDEMGINIIIIEVTHANGFHFSK